ncbi:MAG: hypothetical protein ACK4GD_04005 [Sphingomonadaceae bacterium]
MTIPGQPDSYESLLRQELLPGERLLWHARAVARIKRGTVPVFLFAIPWTAFSLFWIGMSFVMISSSAEDPWLMWVFPLFGLPFLGIGLFMLSRPFLSVIAARKTCYGITDQRVIQLFSGKGILSESVPVDRIGTITRHERSDGSGSLQLKIEDPASVPARNRVAGFDLGEVPDIRRAEQVLRQAMERVGKAS